MTLRRRAPRTVYRVYDQEEFLAGAYRDGALELAPPALVQARAGGRRPRRLASVATLCGALGAAGGLAIMGGLPIAMVAGGRGASTPGSRDLASAARISRTPEWLARRLVRGQALAGAGVARAAWAHPGESGRERREPAGESPWTASAAAARAPSSAGPLRGAAAAPPQTGSPADAPAPGARSVQAAGANGSPAGEPADDARLSVASSASAVSHAPAEFGFER